jgi:hypothetical protein
VTCGCSRTTLDWLPGLLVAAGAAAAALLAGGATGRLRAGVVAALLAVLLIGPATWAVQTLGHATSGTFPAGGPATIGFGGPGGGPGAGGAAGAGAGAPGGSFGGDSSVAAALAYARAHGGGTVAVSSQNGAAQEVSAGQGVVALGGFSGRETQVSLRWLAGAVASGKVRWVLADSTGGPGMPNDGRVGARDLMTAVQQVGTPATGVSGLYDLQGKADALRALG